MLDVTSGTVWVLVLAAAFGALGGAGHQVLQAVVRVSLPDQPVPRLSAAAAWSSSVFLGLLAAVSVIYFLPPTEATTGRPSTTPTYSLIKLVPLSIIAGLAGAQVITALVNRVFAAAAAQQAAAATQAAADATKHSAAPKPILDAAAAAGTTSPGNAVQQIQATLTDIAHTATAELTETLTAHAAAAKNAIDVAATTTAPSLAPTGEPAS